MYCGLVPKVADPAVRIALIEHAARITAEEGRQALTLRRLANEVGASTMVVYTHFGGMDDLRREVRREGFDRLRVFLGSVDATSDAVADLLAQGAAYFRNAVTNPNLYRAMFMDQHLGEDDGEPIGLDTFEMLVDVVTRCIDAGRFDAADPVVLANQVWAMAHGVVTLHLAGMFSDDDAVACLRTGARNLLLAFGDTPAALARSVKRAEGR
jgi:AcrR family transcriptional regulator